MKDIDVHKIDRKLELALERINTESISKRNKDVILKFYNDAYSRGLGKKRILKYLFMLLMLARWMDVSFEDASKDDIMKLLRKIEQQNYSEWTVRDYKIIIKRFYKWLNGDKDYPEKVKWIKTTFRTYRAKPPEDLITREEIDRMIKIATNLRDKALVALIFESGFRSEELLTLKIKQVVFDEFGAKIVGAGKTGVRRIRLVSSVPYLAAWIESHPFRDNPEANLWMKKRPGIPGEILYYNNFRKIIKTLAKKAGINKRIYPHLFRHSRATYLANHFTEAQMNQYFGWKQGSDMPSTYVHLSGRDLDQTILELNGLKEERKEKEHTIKKCCRCEMLNPENGKFCQRCGAVLDQETAIRIEEKWKEFNGPMGALLNDPEVIDLLISKMKQMNIGLDQPSVK